MIGDSVLKRRASQLGLMLLCMGLIWTCLSKSKSVWAENLKYDGSKQQVTYSGDKIGSTAEKEIAGGASVSASEQTEGTDLSNKQEFSFWASPDGSPPLSERAAKKIFPVYPIVEKQKQFWIAIFTEHTSSQGLLHDGLVGLPTYEKVNLKRLSRRGQKKLIRKRKGIVSRNLLALASAVEKREQLSKKQSELLALFSKGVKPDHLRKSALNVRFQRGLSDKFREGLERSSSVLIHARNSMRKYDLPLDLAFLPHVESSFHNKAYSHKNAAGMWQFTRSTGRLYMNINYEVDERLDPVIASDAAALFLKQNYKKLKTWPLAITAYNHGPYSLERIVAKQGTRNLGKLIENYHGGLFKIASKNFYAEFLAARTIALQPEKYFPDLKIKPVLAFQEKSMPFYLDATFATKLLGTSKKEMKRLNPALRNAIWSGNRLIPPTYSLRLPPNTDLEKFIASVPQKQRFKKQHRTWVVRVKSGDTLYSIGRRYKTSWRNIAQANNIVSYRRLMPGQKLVIPYKGQTAPSNVKKIQQNIRTDNAKKQAIKVADTVASNEKNQLTTKSTFVYPSKHWRKLQVLSYSASSSEAKISATYGEAIGHYSDWSGTGLSRILRANRISSRSRVRVGRSYRVPLRVSKEEFEKRRISYHAQQEVKFYQRFRITDKRILTIKRGQTAWTIAQPNRVPMWLFYQENPLLQNKVLQPGMKLTLPIVTPIKG